jgi:thioredoxin-like negative regulator of GroEL
MPNNCHLVIVDVDEGNDISASMKIKQVPTFMNFIDGYPQDVYASSGEEQVHEFMTKTFNRINGTLE